MRRYVIILLLIFFSFCGKISGSGNDIVFSGNYQNVSFEEFIGDLENKNNIRFFYKKEWISEIKITAKGDSLSLSRVLEENLKNTDVSFYINENRNVFVTQENLITVLPRDAIRNPLINNNLLSNKVENGDISKKYFPGEKTKIVETLIIGDKDKMKANDQVIINGRIRNIENGESLIGATIYIEDLMKGTVTDVDGRFSIVLEPGRYKALFNCMGMKEKGYFLQVYSDGQLEINMEKTIIPINEVVIKADQYHNVRGMQMGFESLNMKSIKEIPLVMGEKDLLKVAKMLPGIQTVGEGASGFNVRGSSADQNMFYINKVPVYNTSHLFGFFSSFNPDIIKDFSIYKSNIPVEYGGRIASIFDITTRQGNKNKFTGRGGISPITGHLALEGPIKKDHSSFVVSGRSTYSDWLLTKIQNRNIRNSEASFYDISANINIESDKDNTFKIFGYSSSDSFNLADISNYGYHNSGGSLIWQHRFSSSLSSEFSALFGNYLFNTINNEEPYSAYKHKYNIGHYELRSDFRWIPNQQHIISYGGSLIYYYLDRGTIIPYGYESNRLESKLGNEEAIQGTVYVSDKLRISDRLTFYGGIRYSLYGLLGPGAVYKYYPEGPKNSENIKEEILYSDGEIMQTYSGPEIRTAFNFNAGPNSSLKLSYNRNKQYLYMLSNTIAVSPVDQWKLCDYHIKPPVSDQVSIGYYKDLPVKGIKTSLEAYYKKTNNVVEYQDGAEFVTSPRIEDDVLQGSQNAYGAELMIKKKAGRLNGWLSYCYSKSSTLVNGTFPWEKINLGKRYPSNYSKPHSLNMVLNYRANRRLSFSTNVVYSTGRPATFPESIYYLKDQEIINYSSRNEYRLPDYFRIDLSINLEGNLKSDKKIHSYWMVNIYNLTGRNNAYSVYFKKEGGKVKGYQMSIFGTQIVTLSWNFKFGNYASE